MILDRGKIGTMPAASEREDEAYLDFVEGLRKWNFAAVDPALMARANVATREFAVRHGRPPASIEDAIEALHALPIAASRNRLIRTVQEMFWERVIATYRKREGELLAELDRADRLGPGSVEWDPNFRYPAYYDRVEFHIQPGNYHADPLAGYIYHYGTKVFFRGENDHDERQREFVCAAPLPRDGVVRRTLDLACSIGQATTATKERFPHAEVWGIDIAAPMVRYAHKRAVEMGLEVHFAQRAIEDLRFPENHFDFITSMIIFHEVPLAVTKQALREIARVLRPGGVYAAADFLPASKLSVVGAYLRYIDSIDNGEPYAEEFISVEMADLLREVGLRPVPGTDGWTKPGRWYSEK
jgi:SAM-dependent methyltransferase